MKKLTLNAVLVLLVVALFFCVSCDGGGLHLIPKDCVVMLGDSMFALSGVETIALQKLSGHVYRTYYISGAQIDVSEEGTGCAEAILTIPEQYYVARQDNPNIRTVIYDGGGNDVLIGAPYVCRASYPGGTLSKACHDMIDEVEKVNRNFWQDMVNDGVKNIICQGFYLTTDRSYWLAGLFFQERTMREFKAFAAKHPRVKMIFINPRLDSYFDNINAEHYTIGDGVHPTAEASQKMANLMWDAMVANNIEQTDKCSGGWWNQ